MACGGVGGSKTPCDTGRPEPDGADTEECIGPELRAERGCGDVGKPMTSGDKASKSTPLAPISLANCSATSSSPTGPAAENFAALLEITPLVSGPCSERSAQVTSLRARGQAPAMHSSKTGAAMVRPGSCATASGPGSPASHLRNGLPALSTLARQAGTETAGWRSPQMTQR